MGQSDWRQDPRLKQMNPEKLKFITDFSERVRGMSKNQVLPAFMSVQMEARKKGLCFSDSETDLLVSILTADMSAAEQKKIQMLRTLAQKMAARTS